VLATVPTAPVWKLLAPSELSSTFTVHGDYVQSGGGTKVQGTLAASQVEINGGTIGGSGTIIGNLVIGADGTLAPGDPQHFQDLGDILLQGTLMETIGGTGASSNFDVTSATGSFILGGHSRLEIELVQGYTPATGSHEKYIILDSGTFRIGSFFDVVFGLQPPGVTFSLDYLANEVVLNIDGPGGINAVPEPVALCL